MHTRVALMQSPLLSSHSAKALHSPHIWLDLTGWGAFLWPQSHAAAVTHCCSSSKINFQLFIYSSCLRFSEDCFTKIALICSLIHLILGRFSSFSWGSKTVSRCDFTVSHFVHRRRECWLKNKKGRHYNAFYRHVPPTPALM